MNLRGVEFDNTFVASGTLNFFGQGWPFHKYYRHIPGFSFNNATLISKTATAEPNPGNMELNDDLQPKKKILNGAHINFLKGTVLFQDCIYVDYAKRIVLNAVGLSNHGIDNLIARNKWQQLENPFIISFACVGKTKDERKTEAIKFSSRLKLAKFKSRFGVEINISCPNNRNHEELDDKEVIDILKIFATSLPETPLIVKFSVVTDITEARKVALCSFCDAISISNSIPFGSKPLKIDWAKLFGSLDSPLKKYGGGAMSGHPLLGLTYEWISRARRFGINIPIIAGGGILSKSDVHHLYDARINAIAIGSVAILHPWRVQGIINHANALFEKQAVK